MRGREKTKRRVDKEEDKEVEVHKVKPTCRKVVKSVAVITDEIDEAAAAAGKEIEWSLADKQQAEIHFTDQMPLQLILGCDHEFQIGNFTKSAFRS